MIVGVCSYSFAIGSLTNLLSNLDSRDANLKAKLHILQQIKSQYNLGTEFFMRLRKQLKYDHSKNVVDKFKLLHELPPNLKFELSYIIHEDILAKFPFFQKKDKEFLAFLGPLLNLSKFQREISCINQINPQMKYIS
jgi:hypothetical protein